MSLMVRIRLPDLEHEPEVEDIYATHLANLFADHTPNAHGDPGQTILYESPVFGDIKLLIPEYPRLDNQRQLFAHSLWNAAVVAAEGIERASTSASVNVDETVGLNDTNDSSQRQIKDGQDPWQQHDWDKRYWDMRGADVLELGAGTALPSIVAYLSGARSLTITDHPTSTAITTNTITLNILRNNSASLKNTRTSSPPAPEPETSRDSLTLPSNVQVYGYRWGETTFYDPPSTSPTATTTSSSSSSASNNDDDKAQLVSVSAKQQPGFKSFTKIVVADCLWIPSKHVSICKTIQDYLVDDKHNPNTTSPSNNSNEPTNSEQQNGDNDDNTNPRPCALVIAGFHTGRAVISDFFAIATASHEHSNTRVHYDDGPINEQDPLTPSVKGKLKIAEIFEIDIDGRRREWLTSRPGESVEDAKRWCVCSVLVKR